MKVYCVMENDYEGSYLIAIWSTEEKAKAHLERLLGGMYQAYLFPGYSVEEFIVDDEEIG